MSINRQLISCEVDKNFFSSFGEKSSAGSSFAVEKVFDESLKFGRIIKPDSLKREIPSSSSSTFSSWNERKWKLETCCCCFNGNSNNNNNNSSNNNSNKATTLLRLLSGRSRESWSTYNWTHLAASLIRKTIISQFVTATKLQWIFYASKKWFILNSKIIYV